MHSGNIYFLRLLYNFTKNNRGENRTRITLELTLFFIISDRAELETLIQKPLKEPN